MDLLYWSRHFRNMPGEGDLPVTDFMRAVAATGYDGPLSLEIFNDQFRGGSPKSIAVDGHRSLVYLMDQVRRAEPAAATLVPPMPDRIDVYGVEFVEFAADADGPRRSLGRFLHGMGFRKAGRHVTKDVDALPAGRHQPRRQHRARGLRPFRLPHPRHSASAPSASGSRTPPPRSSAPRALGAQIFEQRGRPRRAHHPGDPRRRRRRDLLHRPEPGARPGLGDRVRRRRGRRSPSPTPASSRSTTSPRP